MASPVEKTKPIKDLLRQLRRALNLTQERVAERAGLERTYVVKVETGHNQASTVDLRASLARGYGIPRDLLNDYLDGGLSLEALLGRLKLPADPTGPLLRTHPRWAELVAEARRIRKLPPEAFERLADSPWVFGPLELIDATVLADVASVVHDWAERSTPETPPSSRRPR